MNSSILTPGTVFTFTADLTRINVRWAKRVMGAHFIVTGLSSSGYCVEVLNTMTGRSDGITIEDWWMRKTRVIFTPAA
jgi:hypothetical protein